MTETKFAFQSDVRLNKPVDYKRVFADPERSSDKFFTLLTRKNNLDNARLGLAIAKKNIRRAVSRTLIKRIIRESFRLHQQKIGNIDIVVMARSNAGSVSSKILRQSLEKHWLKLEKRCGSFSSN